jgi:hypothetical protein
MLKDNGNADDRIVKLMDWGGVVVKALRYESEGPGTIPGGVNGEFFLCIRQLHVPGVDSAS